MSLGATQDRKDAFCQFLQLVEDRPARWDKVQQYMMDAGVVHFLENGP